MANLTNHFLIKPNLGEVEQGFKLFCREALAEFRCGFLAVPRIVYESKPLKPVRPRLLTQLLGHPQRQR